MKSELQEFTYDDSYARGKALAVEHAKQVQLEREKEPDSDARDAFEDGYIDEILGA
jgi:hypothetical protein